MFFVKRWLVEVFDDPVGGMQGEGGSYLEGTGDYTFI